jgi:anti-sigma B factor antagonist
MRHPEAPRFHQRGEGSRACLKLTDGTYSSSIDLRPRPFYHFPKPMPMTITTREVSHVTIVDLNGRITLGDETGKLRDAIRQLIAAGKKKIILNLAHIDYIDSSGVGELVSSYTAVRNSGGDLKLLSLTKKVQDVLHVTKLYTVFDIKDDEFTAVKSFDYFFAK